MTKNIETKAPRNRTIFLTPEDYQHYAILELLPEGKDVIPVARASNKIFYASCLAGMSRLPKASMDLIFADPPYYGRDKDFGNGTINLSLDEYVNWSDHWISLAAGLLKKTGSMYVCCDWRFSGKIQEILNKYLIIKNRITWLREKGRGSLRNWKEDMEDIWFCVASEAYTFNVENVKIRKPIVAPYRYENKQPKGWIENNDDRYRYTYPPNIWLDTVVPFWSMYENTPHPTQKPEKLVERIILASSNLGDLVLDPFMGAGTTAVVAKRLGRNFIGFEVNEDYVRLALKRLDKLTQEQFLSTSKKDKHRLVMLI